MAAAGGPVAVGVAVVMMGWDGEEDGKGEVFGCRGRLKWRAAGSGVARGGWVWIECVECHIKEQVLSARISLALTCTTRSP